MSTSFASPPFAVGTTLMGYTVAEFQIVVGVTSLTIDQTSANAFGLTANPNWQSVLTMSPSTAKHLHRQLTDCLRSYEAKFGEIPSDPTAADASSATITPLRLVSDDPLGPESARPSVSEPPEQPEPPPCAA